ncbi:hypothetical protein M569_00046, partial [Genlisea aurea]
WLAYLHAHSHLSVIVFPCKLACNILGDDISIADSKVYCDALETFKVQVSLPVSEIGCAEFA